MIKDIHIIVFTGRHPVLSFFIEQFVKYLEKTGIDYYLVDADCPETYNCVAFDKFAIRPNTVAFMFNNIGIGMLTEGGDSFWESHSIPVFTYLVDHPRNFGDNLRNPVCSIYAFGLDLDHIAFMKEHFTKLKGVFFSPNGGTGMNCNTPFRDRSIDVLYMGDCNPAPEELPVIDNDKIDFADYYRITAGMMVGDTSLSTDDAIDRYLTSKNIILSETEKYDLICTTAVFIENAMRHKTKLEGMKALDNVGVHVEVYGSNWITNECPFTENIMIHERIDIRELLKKASDAKICLCFMPWFKKGCSEKNFDAMLNGSLCVTDSSDYLKTNYKDGHNIVYFDLNNPYQMAVDIKWLLDNPDKASAIAERGCETCLKYDTWDKRFDFILAKMHAALE